MKMERLAGGLTCKQVLDGLSAFIDGELGDEELKGVRAHVAACSNCERFGGRFAEAVRALRALPEPAPLSDALFERLCTVESRKP